MFYRTGVIADGSFFIAGIDNLIMFIQQNGREHTKKEKLQY